jgi:hypothetical protein
MTECQRVNKDRIQSTDRSVLSKISGVSTVSAIVSWLAEHMRKIEKHFPSSSTKQFRPTEATGYESRYGICYESQFGNLGMSFVNLPRSRWSHGKKHLFVFQK